MRNSYHTQQRCALLAFLSAHADEQFTVEQLLTAMGDAAPGRSTVYRHLEELCREGAISRFAAESGKSVTYRVIGSECGDDCHFHLICTACGEVCHTHCRELEALFAHMAAAHGCEMWSEDHWKMIEKYGRKMRRMRQNVFWITWDLVDAEKTDAGGYHFDFSNIDIMLEVKDKDVSAIKTINTINYIKNSFSTSNFLSEIESYKLFVLEKSEYQGLSILEDIKKTSNFTKLYNFIDSLIYTDYNEINFRLALNKAFESIRNKLNSKEINHYNKTYKNEDYIKCKEYLKKLSDKYDLSLNKTYYFIY